MNRTAICLLALLIATGPAAAETYPVVDTGQDRTYNNSHEIVYPAAGEAFCGQDAQYAGHQPSYRDNGDGTISDLNTGLMWQKDPGEKRTYAEIVADVKRCRTGGYNDWRLPTVKELYSLILFSGTDDGPTSTAGRRPFLDTRYFNFQYGNPADGDRVIDSQWATSTIYRGRVMSGQRAMFGVNFADGRIKGYPIDRTPRGTKTFYAIYVRENRDYGKNNFVDNGDGTVTDRATGLTWMKLDSAALKAGPRRDGRLNWAEALAWAEGLTYAGQDDWRLPNAKELQSIVDYSRAPDVTGSAAIDPVFQATAIRNEAGQKDYGYYWTSTTHASSSYAGNAAYIAFGRGLGAMGRPGSQSSQKTVMDVHGAGVQRSDPKYAPLASASQSRGPQGDMLRTYNLVRLVRGGQAEPVATGPTPTMTTARRPGPPEQASASAGPRTERPSSSQTSQRKDRFIGRLDRDGDGKVSRSEFDGPADAFNQFDRNRDGKISAAEAPTGPPPPRRR